MASETSQLLTCPKPPPEEIAELTAEALEAFLEFRIKQTGLSEESEEP
jgi:hypothetical protein